MEEKIEFNNNNNQKLVGIIEKPLGDGPFPAVIDCHGFTGNKEGNFHPRLTKSLSNNGFVTLRFDFTGNGESEGIFSDGNVLQEVEDVKKAIDLLESKDYIDNNKIGIIGHGMGGVVSIIAASKDDRIKALVPLSLGLLFDNYMQAKMGDLLPDLNSKGYLMYSKIHNDGNMKTYKITKKFCEVRQEIDPLEIIKNVNQPIMFLFGTHDGPGSSPESIEQMFENANEPKNIEIIEEADHCFTDKTHEETMIKFVGEFFLRHLK
jgi:uncharacterized protein